MGVAHQLVDQVEIDRYLANARKQLDQAAFQTAWEEGRAMSLEEAVGYALGRDEE
jgi:hypothetical protein